METVSLMPIVVGLLSVLVGVLGWLSKEMWSIVKTMKEEIKEINEELRKELHVIKETLPDKYVRQSDFKEFRLEFKEILVRIETKIDMKADRPVGT